MSNQKNKFAHSNRWIACILLFSLIFIAYSNTFKASWHFDDFPKIVQNPILKIHNIDVQSLSKTFSANRKDGLYTSTKIYRPLPLLSFALNWYFGKLNVIGYHLVNISIHFITAFILFLAVLALLRAPNLKGKYEDSEYFIAFLTAVLWAANPLQTQAVTYIVQRVAAMAAMFYILAIFFYVKGRNHRYQSKQIGFYMACLISYVCALLSKANSATLPIALIMVEVIFFQDLSRPRIRKRVVFVTLGASFCVVILGFLLYLQGDPLSIFKSYDHRFFSPLQRLMTEPRILIFYLSQLFYPVPTRLSIEHDVSISTSLFSPWTTLPSIFLILFLIGYGIFQIRKKPVLSFAILFFFLNHFIESTIVALELIFEHRNYLPSLFIFLPVSVGIKWLFDYYSEKKRSMYYILVSFVTLMIIGFGTGTYIRNMTWATEKTLWEDAIAKAPGMGRPYQNLAWAYYLRIGQYDQAMELFEKSLQLKMHSRHSKAGAINNMGHIFFLNGEIYKASRLFEQAYRLYPRHSLYQLNLSKAREKSGDRQTALLLLDKILLKDPTNQHALNLKGQIFLKENKLEEAIEHFERLLKLKPNDPMVMLNLGISFRLMEKLDRAELYFKAAHIRDPKEIYILLWLIENNLVMDDHMDADRHLQRLLTVTSINKLVETIHTIGEDELMPNSLRERLIREITAKLKEDSETIINLK
jgi:Flp pilus assembly protein TadD